MRELWSLHAYHYRGEIRTLGRGYVAFRPGWVGLIPAGVLAEWRFPSHAPHHYAHFALEDSGRAPMRLPVLQDLGHAFDGYCAAFDEMIRYFQPDPERAAVRLWDLLHRLRGEPPGLALKPPLHPTLQIALSYIHNPRPGLLAVGRIARAMGVSHNHLTNLFRKHYGIGVRQFIQREQLSRACDLLANSALSVKSIANEIGIPDLQYFNKLIRRKTGLSPRAYREAASKPARGSKPAGGSKTPLPEARCD